MRKDRQPADHEEIALEKEREREHRCISCPGGGGKTQVVCEWEIVSEKGRILKRTLRQIDCFNPQLSLFGGTDCNWDCERVIAKREG